jgi:hypothetical protein
MLSELQPPGRIRTPGLHSSLKRPETCVGELTGVLPLKPPEVIQGGKWKGYTPPPMPKRGT